MRWILLLGLTLLFSCGGKQKKECFECGLTDEWRRAEQEERERTNAEDVDQGETPIAAADAGPGEAPIAPDAQPAQVQRCGGIAGFRCPDGLKCVDDPKDSCEPEQGGRDCGGICVQSGAASPKP